MHTSKSSAIDDILSKTGDEDGYEYEAPAARKPAPKAAKPAARNTQAWRAIEDMKESQRLKRGLKEVYDEDGVEEK
jgi:hypothetical protein